MRNFSFPQFQLCRKQLSLVLGQLFVAFYRVFYRRKQHIFEVRHIFQEICCLFRPFFPKNTANLIFGTAKTLFSRKNVVFRTAFTMKNTTFAVPEKNIKNYNIPPERFAASTPQDRFTSPAPPLCYCSAVFFSGSCVTMIAANISMQPVISRPDIIS